MGFVIFLIIVVVAVFVIKTIIDRGKNDEKQERFIAEKAKIQSLVDEGGSPEQIRIGAFDNSELAGSDQYSVVKFFIFHLVKKGYELSFVGVDKCSGTKKQYCYISFQDGGWIEFTKSMYMINQTWSYSGYWSSACKDWRILHAGGIGIREESSDYVDSKPSDFLLACADIIKTYSLTFVDPEWYPKAKSYSSSSPLVKMHEYIKTGEKSW